MAEQRKRLRLGDLLVQQGLISPDQLTILLAEQRNSGVPLGRLVVRLRFATESAVRDAMARTVGQESIDLTNVVADPDALQMVPQDFARRNQVLPLAYSSAEGSLTIATTEIFNVVVMDQLRALVGANIDIRSQIAAEAQVEEYIDRFYGYELSVDGILKEIETGEIDYESLRAGGDEYTQPMVRLVNALLVDAVKRGASDIHFEPEYAFLRIRYRIDGVLETVRSLHKTFSSGITVRLKVISNMNIAETRAPQDDWVLVHDAVRPCVTTGDICRLLGEVAEHPVGGLLAVPVSSTLKKAGADGDICATVDRTDLWQASTPQVFRYGLLRKTLTDAVAAGVLVTDEASALELAGFAPRLVRGRADNIKITFPEDLPLASLILQAQARE